MSTRMAAATFKVPRSTLYAKHKDIIPVEGVKGPSTYLTAEEEKLLVDWIFYCGERGFPVTKSLLLQCVQKLVTEIERKTPLKNNQPGRFNQMSDELQDVHTKTNENGAVENIPSLFRKAMVWPADIIKNKKNKKKPARKVSTVLTSEEWQKQQLQIQEEKLRKQKEIEERKKLREEVKRRKAEEKQIKKAALEEKKKLDQEIKRLMAQKKKIRIKQEKVD